MAEGGGSRGVDEAQKLTCTSVFAQSPPAVSTQRFSLSPSRPRPIVNGLQLRMPKQEQPFRGYTYLPVPQDVIPIPVDWRLLESGDVESEYIRVHDLQREELEEEGEGLVAALKVYQAAYAKAVVIINVAESLILPKEVEMKMKELEGFPVVAVTRSDGERLLECLQVQYEDDELHAQLVTDSAVMEEEEEDDNDTAILDPPNSLAGYGRPESHRERGIFQIFLRRKDFDIRSEMKKLVFDGEVMRKVSEDAARFTMVMATFSQYERTASSSGSHSDVNHLLRLFLRYFPQAFEYEYPFFLVLANRMYKFRAVYECDELAGFIRECISLFEKMLPVRVEETLMGFIRKRDFDVLDGAEEFSSSVFMLLANACINLMVLSTKVRKSDSKVSTASIPHVVYHRMLWISMYLKCVGAKGMITRTTIKTWEVHFIRFRTSIPITRETVSDFKAGLHVSKLLQLNPELQFTPQHMANFLAGDNCIRPLAQVRYFIIFMETHITTERDLLVTFLISLRSWYATGISDKNCSKASEDGTVLGIIDEGISFLDAMTELWARKGWKKSSQNKDFRLCIRDWLQMLLLLVQINDPSVVTMLKKFLSPRRGVVADQEFRRLITQKVLETTRTNFQLLDIHQFFILYKAFRIWSTEFLSEFLKQYRMPKDVKICDLSWTEFFNVILDRFHTQLLQLQLLEFLKRVGERYYDDKRTIHFIPDLLLLNVPHLFVSDSENQLTNSTSVGNQFVQYLKGYVKRNNLQLSLVNLIHSILNNLSDQHQYNFQRLIFTVLQSEIIPQFKALQGDEKMINQQLRNVLTVCVSVLCQKVSWFSSLSPRQEFCWGVVTTCSNKIPVTAENFDWIFSFDFVILQLGQVFNTYVNDRRLQGADCILSQKFPDEVVNCSSNDIIQFFQWVRKSQDVLAVWQEKFLNNEVNYDDVLVYSSHHVSIDKLGRALCARAIVMDSLDIQEVKDMFITHYDLLNTYLLRYIPGHPESKWITLPALLAHYGARLPLHLQETLSKHVLFPGEQKQLVGQLLCNKFPIGNGMFQPGHEIALELTRSITLKKLVELLQDIIALLQDILENLDLLVFFHLQQSEIFKKHLLKYLEDATKVEATTERVKTNTFSLFPLRSAMSYQMHTPKPTPPPKQQESGVTLELLEKALESIRNLLYRLGDGTATYSDIVAGGALKLESLDIEREFEIFTEYAHHAGIAQFDGQAGVQCMLELFQFMHHIRTIHNVCKQFQLQHCLNDPTLHKLLEIVKELSSEDSRAKLTPIDARKKLNIIKTSLCLEGSVNYSCLNIFPVVANSAALYQFIQEKQFAGEKGQALFQQQYQLITAKLQHDDNVLKQLSAAFFFMTSFMDKEQNFQSLMYQATKLNTIHRLKQLDTVNENITLVRSWFSRAEPAAVQNHDTNDEHHCFLTVHSHHVMAEKQLVDQVPNWLKTDTKIVVGVKIPSFHDPMTGMVKFIGVVQVKGVDKLIAGVQLDEPMVGCTDGTYEGKRLFVCPAETGYFCPISDLMDLTSNYIYLDVSPGTSATGKAPPTLATRAPPIAAGSVYNNPLSEYAHYEKDDQQGGPALFTQYIGEPKGIQGHHDSCYLDSTVFGLFALSDAFDVMFLDAASQALMQGSSSQEKEYCMKMKDILWKGIINPLRKNGVARFESVMKLRNYLEHLGTMEGANKDEKDPKEFLNILFKVLHVRPFISIRRLFGVKEEYFLQLFFEINPEENVIPFTEVLLWNMFKEQNISFTEIPSKLLLQMPQFGKEFKMCNRIFPSLTVDVAPILDPSHSSYDQPFCSVCTTTPAAVFCKECAQEVFRVNNDKIHFCHECSEKFHKNHSHHQPVNLTSVPADISLYSKLKLLSVICIETSHYVCFTRCEDRWLFHDSMADRTDDMYNIPRVTEVTQELNEWVYSGNVERLMNSKSQEIPECVRRFAQDAYMCVYVKPELDMYVTKDVNFEPWKSSSQAAVCSASAANPHIYQQSEIEQLSDEVAILKQEKKILETALNEKKTALSHAEQSVSQLEGQLKTVTVENQTLLQQQTQENTRLQRENDDYQREITRLQNDNDQKQKQVNNLQCRLAQQPKVVPDSDISFWLVSRDEVRSTGQVLGEGAWGRVTVGMFRGQKVAIKEIHSTIRSKHNDELVFREISLMARVRHPNLLLFIAAVQNSPSCIDPIFITELLDTDLRKAYQDGQLDNNRIRISILRDVAAALNYLHLQREPIIHRDVSSANVLLQALPDNWWRGKLSDFGSANLVRDATTAAPGAAVYCAPEASVKGKQSPKIDVYSYGTLFCEVFNCQFPYLEEFPSMLQSMAHSWPLMHKIIIRCVEHDPVNRPTMSSIVNQLNVFTCTQ